MYQLLSNLVNYVDVQTKIAACRCHGGAINVYDFLPNCFSFAISWTNSNDNKAKIIFQSLKGGSRLCRGLPEFFRSSSCSCSQFPQLQQTVASSLRVVFILEVTTKMRVTSKTTTCRWKRGEHLSNSFSMVGINLFLRTTNHSQLLLWELHFFLLSASQTLIIYLYIEYAKRAEEGWERQSD